MLANFMPVCYPFSPQISVVGGGIREGRRDTPVSVLFFRSCGLNSIIRLRRLGEEEEEKEKGLFD